MSAKDLTAERVHEEIGEKWRTMIDTPERILSDMRNAYDWAMRQEMIPAMLNPCQVKMESSVTFSRLIDRRVVTNQLFIRRECQLFCRAYEAGAAKPDCTLSCFAILTSARNTTAREATWDEIQQDDDGHWLHVIPRDRMKMKSDKIPFDRKTPLSNQAKALLDTAPRFPNDEKGLCFPISIRATCLHFHGILSGRFSNECTLSRERLMVLVGSIQIRKRVMVNHA